MKLYIWTIILYVIHMKSNIVETRSLSRRKTWKRSERLLDARFNVGAFDNADEEFDYSDKEDVQSSDMYSSRKDFEKHFNDIMDDTIDSKEFERNYGTVNLLSLGTNCVNKEICVNINGKHLCTAKPKDCNSIG